MPGRTPDESLDLSHADDDPPPHPEDRQLLKRWGHRQRDALEQLELDTWRRIVDRLGDVDRHD